LLSVESVLPFLGSGGIHYRLRLLPGLREGSSAVAEEVLRRLTTIANLLPTPMSSAANAVRCYHGSNGDWWRFPGVSVSQSQNTIRLSSRALLEILSGRK